MSFPLINSRYHTLITAYALTMINSPEKLSSFYHQLDQILRAIPNADKIIFLKYLNARFGQSHNLWPKVLGKFDTRKDNANCKLLISFYAEHQHLLLTQANLQELLDEYLIQTLAHHRLHHHVTSVISQTFWTQECLQEPTVMIKSTTKPWKKRTMKKDIILIRKLATKLTKIKSRLINNEDIFTDGPVTLKESVPVRSPK